MTCLKNIAWFLIGIAIAILLSGCSHPNYRIIPQWWLYPPEKGQEPDYYVAYPMNKEHRAER